LNRVFVTGGAGFIGSHLVDRLLGEGNRVTVIDNLSSGSMRNIERHLANQRFIFVRGSLLDYRQLVKAMEGNDVIFHLGAHSDVMEGVSRPEVDFENNTMATRFVLEAMRVNGVSKIVFASSASVYGETTEVPVSEDYGPVLPASMYGASKLACEGLISAYSQTFGV
jgi:UDP-glucose 4-epimerase